LLPLLSTHELSYSWERNAMRLEFCVLLYAGRIPEAHVARDHMLRALVSEVYVDAWVLWSMHNVLARTVCTSSSSPACMIGSVRHAAHV
jgi:hypothetical protein